MVRRRGGDAWAAPRHRLVLRSEVDRRGRIGGGTVGVETGGDEYGTAASADGGHIRRREGYVVLRVQRARNVACQVRQWDVSCGDVMVCVARRAGDEREDVRERPGVSWGRRLARASWGNVTYLFVSPRPSDPRPQLASTVERDE